MNSVESGLQKREDCFSSFPLVLFFLNFLLSIPVSPLSTTTPGRVAA